MSSIEPFNRLVKLAARAFYDDKPPKGENQPKTGRSDNRGIAVVVLDALTRRQWVREEDLAKDLKLHTKQLRRTLKSFEEEKLITRDHRKETAKGAKIHNAAVAAIGDGHQTGREGEEKQKMHTHSYCCLDYAQIYDVVRYRLHRMKKKLKDELESKNTIQEYICSNCSKRYTALDALQLYTEYDEYFHCVSCEGVLMAESDNLVAQELGDGDDNARRHRHEKIKDMLSKMEVQLKPLIDQLARVKDLPVPEYGSLHAWEIRAKAAGRSGNGDPNSDDPSRLSQGLGFGGTPMPYVGETKVEVALPGIDENKDDVKSVTPNAPTKILPPWMIKEGMTLTKEQRGETKADGIKTDDTTTEPSDDKKSAAADKNIEREYIEAYYAAILRQQEEMMKRQEAAYNTPTERQVGVKSKREDDVQLEEAPPKAGRSDNYKVYDLNQEAAASEDEEEDEIDWEEG